MEDYYENLDLKYIEIAVAAKKFFTTDSTAKFYIPALMPLFGSTDKQYPTSLPSSTNILNQEKPTISRNAYTSGYITIPLHIERLGSWHENKVPAGAEFMVVFVGGDLNKPRILGRY